MTTAKDALDAIPLMQLGAHGNTIEKALHLLAAVEDGKLAVYDGHDGEPFNIDEINKLLGEEQ